MTNLLNGLTNHEFDLVLTNRSVNRNDEEAVWQNQLVSRQSVSIIGPASLKPNTSFPDGYQQFQWVLPSQITEIRLSFDAYCAIKNLNPTFWLRPMIWGCYAYLSEILEQSLRFHPLLLRTK
jgi:LysR family transcriptional activator of nhaA